MAPWKFLLKGGENPTTQLQWEVFSIFKILLSIKRQSNLLADTIRVQLIKSLFIYRDTRGTGELGLSPLYMKRGRERVGERLLFEC